MSLSSLEDGIAALLADPLEQHLHAQVLDRLSEDTEDPRKAALALVLANPASDGPRLVKLCKLRCF